MHNNYLALPVVFTMISTHFPFLYGYEYAWLALVALMLIGAWVRHFFNLRTRAERWWIPVTAAAAVVALALAIRPDEAAEPVGRTGDRRGGDRDRRAALRPLPLGRARRRKFTSAPAGVVLDTRSRSPTAAEAIRAGGRHAGDAARERHRDDRRGAGAARRLDRRPFE